MDNHLKNEILNKARGLPLLELFNQYQSHYGNVHTKPEIKEMFLKFMLKLIKEKELKLAKNNKILNKSPEELIALFRNSWPPYYDSNDPQKDIDWLWWICSAPASAVWIYPDGWEEWT